MNARPLLTLLAMALPACTGGGAPRSMDASADADATARLDGATPRRDATIDARDAGADAIAPPPWLDGSLTLPMRENRWPSNQFSLCAGRVALSPSHPMLNYDAHWWNGTIYFSHTGTPARVVPGSGLIQGLSDSQFQLGGTVAISGERLIYAASWRGAHAEAVIAFDRVEQGAVGRTLWHRERVNTDSEGGFWDLTATPSLIAFSWQDSRETGDWSTRVYAMNPDGTDVRVLSPRNIPQSGDVRASGDRVVFRGGGQVYLWQRGDAEARPIDPTQRSQWHPWIDGDNVVWIDQRDSPRGSIYSPYNPEVYYKNLRTGEVRRITHDPDTRPVFQAEVTVGGDWIAWTDLRHASNPNPESPLGDRIAVYGFHIPSQTEYALANEPSCITAVPLLLNGRLFVAGRGVGSMYEFPLPTIAPRDQ
jgi:hypothetical protein